jgi:hypothetical protein
VKVDRIVSDEDTPPRKVGTSARCEVDERDARRSFLDNGGMASRRLALVATALAVCACSGESVLIRSSDRTFERSLQRYERTRQLVEADPSARSETAIFLQAEAFYRYRFEPPRRSLGGYLAQAAAAAMDFPAFQAVAASLDLFDLRLKANDGAIQLWETLLARYPRTSLRPLILYRLGWAYRNQITAGFPRGDPNEIFQQLLTEYGASPYALLAREAQTVPRKSPAKVTGWSIIPGAGQIYAGETGNGLARIAIAIVGAALVAVPSVLAATKANRHEHITTGQAFAYAGTAVGGLVILSIDYTLAYQDGLRAVMQFNERAEMSFEDRHAEAP